jgi:hypothetical protein
MDKNKEQNYQERFMVSKEPCHFCGVESAYWDFKDGKLINVCSRHIKIEVS